ncbi:hypothetical protein Lfu02_79980 [Longispora fulva]|uniref:5-methylcytosine-specific restriction protein A n=1 Tax=Longispora fulva TaxID=619741 RepID=A0A8J7GXS9_9ACTN|nr:HNH endonuclease signature motif containing protein [Longispora fulva]MBG6141119.1 5-methylcytosine-specific restriction protein A [Longispora fulva]GIG63626.1 hypothetical protein Lfu02_79980 [Longispora fulva]
MPRAAKTCSTRDCPNITRAGRCADCRRAAEAARGSARERGYDARWDRTRAAFLARRPRCARLGCTRTATDVDHRDGLGPLGPRGHDPANLRPLCHEHHSQRTARDQPGGWNRRV